MAHGCGLTAAYSATSCSSHLVTVAEFYSKFTRMNEIFVFIHSPFVGPFTWMPVAEKLSQMGHRTIIPSLHEALPAASGFGAFAGRVATAVANSGKGRWTGEVFDDSRLLNVLPLPPRDGAF